jgi:hypothetical protein
MSSLLPALLRLWTLLHTVHPCTPSLTKSQLLRALTGHAPHCWPPKEHSFGVCREAEQHKPLVPWGTLPSGQERNGFLHNEELLRFHLLASLPTLIQDSKVLNYYPPYCKSCVCILQHYTTHASLCVVYAVPGKTLEESTISSLHKQLKALC